MILLLAASFLCGDVSVYAAASLRESFDKIGARFEAAHPGEHVRLNLGASQELRVQIEHGAPADVFASADTQNMDALVKAGLARSPRIFARNTLVIAVGKGNPSGVKGLRDLTRLTRVVLAGPEVPAGKYARQLLVKEGIVETVRPRIVSLELNVRQVAQKVALGEAEAGIVYRTDALAFRDKLDAIDLPTNVIAEYPAAAVRDREPARAFVDFLLGPEAQKILAEAGFRAPK